MAQRVIYDIGLHKGEDTEYYLARGYRVVAIEADPNLVSYCQIKFRKFVDSQDLVIIHGAIVEDDCQSTVKFYKNNHISVWGTTVKMWAERNAMLGCDSTEIEVPVVRLDSIFSRYGCPYYLKIDIEGMDLVCLKKLLPLECRPRWISIESDKVEFAALVEEFDVLERLGYSRFFVQQQADISSRNIPAESQEGVCSEWSFSSGSTGPFATDLGDKWISRDEAITRYRKIFREYKLFGDYSLIRRIPLGGYFLAALERILARPLPGWYDTHASRE